MGTNLDLTATLAKLNVNLGQKTSHRKCAATVLDAVAAGGVRVTRGVRDAKDYGPNMLAAGFSEVSSDPYTNPQAGDVVIIQSPGPASTAGHMTMYNGSVWISDFEQRDMWSGPAFRAAKPEFHVYRYKFITNRPTASTTAKAGS